MKPRSLAPKALAPSLLLVLAACGGGTPPAAPAAPPAPETNAAPAAPVVTETPAAPAKPEPPKPVATWTGLATPESVLYDAENDRYLVSNINGSPVAADNNGFISELSPDGTVKNLKWIEGGAKTKLNAPKGLALAGGVLYVADLDRVRMFDAKTGAAKGEVVLPGATFAGDVAAGPDGKIYATDIAVKLGAKGDFEPTGTDAVWVIEKGKAKALAKSKELNRPNGVLVTSKGVVVNTFGAAEVFVLDEKGQKKDVTTLPKGGLDGLVAFGDDLLVTSWEAQAVFRGTLGGTFVPVVENVKAPADIGFDTKRSRVLVPRFQEDKVEAYELH